MGASGREIHGEISSADASAGVVAAIFAAGTDTTTITLAAGEFIEVTDIGVVAVAGGDIHVFFGTDNTPAAGSTIMRGTLAANSGMLKSFVRTGRHGVAGDSVRLDAPIGQVDLWFTGRIVTA